MSLKRFTWWCNIMSYLTVLLSVSKHKCSKWFHLKKKEKEKLHFGVDWAREEVKSETFLFFPFFSSHLLQVFFYLFFYFIFLPKKKRKFIIIWWVSKAATCQFRCLLTCCKRAKTFFYYFFRRENGSKLRLEKLSLCVFIFYLFYFSYFHPKKKRLLSVRKCLQCDYNELRGLMRKIICVSHLLVHFVFVSIYFFLVNVRSNPLCEITLHLMSGRSTDE